MAEDDDDDRDDNDEGDKPVKVEKKPAATKPASKPKAEPVDEQIALLREIRDQVRAAHERQDRYLWLLLPVIAILLVIAIFQAVKL